MSLSDSDILLEYDIIEDIDWASICSIHSSESDDEMELATSLLAIPEHEEPTIIPTLSRIKDEELHDVNAKLSSNHQPANKEENRHVSMTKQFISYLGKSEVMILILVGLVVASSALVTLAYNLKNVYAKVDMTQTYEVTPVTSESIVASFPNMFKVGFIFGGRDKAIVLDAPVAAESTSVATTYTGTKAPSAWFGRKTSLERSQEDKSNSVIKESFSPPLKRDSSPTENSSYVNVAAQTLSRLQECSMSAYHYVSDDVIALARIQWKKAAKIIKKNVKSIVSSSVTSLDAIQQFANELTNNAEEITQTSLVAIHESSSSLISKLSLNEIIRYINEMAQNAYKHLLQQQVKMKTRIQEEANKVLPDIKHGFQVIKVQINLYSEKVYDSFKNTKIHHHISTIKEKTSKMSNLVYDTAKEADVQYQRNLQRGLGTIKTKSKEMSDYWNKLRKNGMR